MKSNAKAVILTSQQPKEQQHKQSFVDNQDDKEKVDDDGPCWYEVIERLPNKQALNTAYDNSNQSPLTDANNGEQVIALFPTKAEALECVRNKQSFRSRARDADKKWGGKFGWWISCTKTLDVRMHERRRFCSFFVELFTCFNRKKSGHDSS